MRGYRGRRRSRRLDWFTADLNRAESPDAVIFLCWTLIRRLGGVDRVASDWFKHMSEAAPGSKRVMDSILALVRLMEATDAMPEPMEYSRRVNEEVEAQLSHWVRCEAHGVLTWLLDKLPHDLRDAVIAALAGEASGLEES
jgi:hypothetical protein